MCKTVQKIPTGKCKTLQQSQKAHCTTLQQTQQESVKQYSKPQQELVLTVLQARCPAGGALPSRSAAAMRGCTRSAAVFEWLLFVKETSTWMLMVSHQNMALEHNDQCYLFHLSLVLMLWLSVYTHVKCFLQLDSKLPQKALKIFTMTQNNHKETQNLHNDTQIFHKYSQNLPK